jgi:hypothetical protein
VAVCAVFWWGTLRDRDHLRDPGVEGRIILGWIIKKWDREVWTEHLAGFCKAVMELQV